MQVTHVQFREKMEAIIQEVRENGPLSLRDLAWDYGTDPQTIRKHLSDRLKFRKVPSKYGPYYYKVMVVYDAIGGDQS